MSEPARIEIETGTVRRLIASQFPAWADLPIHPVPATGTDNAMFRLGPDLAVRLPRLARAVASLEKEAAWLPRLASRLPLPVPVPIARGKPGESYPWPWSVCRWVEGEHVAPGRIVDETAFAGEVAAFTRALWSLDAKDGPPPGRHNFGRGAPLAERNAAARGGIASLANVFDAAELTRVWEAALASPARTTAPVWIHGDLQGTNLLARDGRLVGVIDFGGLGVGDPACDLIVAWNLFGPAGRAAYRLALQVDDAAWARGRGWALSAGVIAFSYYRDRLPDVAIGAGRTIEAVLADID